MQMNSNLLKKFLQQSLTAWKQKMQTKEITGEAELPEFKRRQDAEKGSESTF